MIGLKNCNEKNQINMKSITNSNELEAAQIKDLSVERYWKKMFADDYCYTKLPFSTNNGAGIEYKEMRFEIEREQFKNVFEVCSDIPERLLVLLISSLGTLLFKYNYENTVCIATPIPSKNIKSPSIGILPLKVDISPGISFVECLSMVQEILREGVVNQGINAEELFKFIGQDSNSKTYPITDIGIAFSEIQQEDMLMKSGLNVILVLDRTSRGMVLRIKYNSFNYNKEDLDGFIGYLMRTLSAVSSAPKTLIQNINLISFSDADCISLGNKENLTVCESIIEIFEGHVKRSPESTAVIYNGIQYSYGTINQKASIVANFIEKSGGAPNNIVAIYMDKSVNLIIGILGILKAGMAYLPIDIIYPDDRIKHILEDASPQFLIKGSNQESLSFTGKTFCIDEILSFTEANYIRKRKVNPENLAYVIYTSGSTGKPKGVMVENRNVVDLIRTDKSLFDFNQQDVWTMFHSHGFDFSVWEIFGALLTGGTLVIVLSSEAQDTTALLKIIDQYNVTILNQTPSAFYHFTREDIRNPINKNKLRYVILGGEILNPSKLATWKAVNPSVKLINMYGITETTVHVTYKEITKKDLNSSICNIGKALPGMQIYLMDQHLNPTPQGGIGEICVGGTGVSRGYINRRLTADRFINSPLGDGQRIYRSGDIGRRLKSGEIEYLGRIDSQVQIRGYRVEVSEIELELINHNGVKDCVVISRDDSEETYLCAYVIPELNSGLKDYRKFLQLKLPDYMIPRYFVILDCFPVNENGKLDKKRLPAPVMEKSSSYKAPTTVTEKKLAQIWADVLGISTNTIGIEDNFFDLGGHSLKAVLVFSHIRKELNVSLPLNEIFVNSTIASLSLSIDHAKEDQYEEITHAKEKKMYGLSYNQKRLYIQNQLNPNNKAYHIPIVLKLKGSVDVAKIQGAIIEMINRHEILRTSFHDTPNGPIQLVNNEVQFKVNYSAKFGVDPIEIANQLFTVFELDKAPLIKADIVEYAVNEYVLIVNIHHIIFDGVSTGVFLSEFSKLISGEPLEQVRYQYKDFSEWQSNVSFERLIGRSKEFWVRQFTDSIPVLDLPSDYRRPAVLTYDGDIVSFKVCKQVTLALNQLAGENNSTLFMVLLSSLSILFAKLSRQQDVVIGTPVAGRNRAEFTKVIGMFVNTLAIRLMLGQDAFFPSFLAEVKRKVIEALEHQNYPFEELLEEVVESRDPSRSPLFSVMFAYQNMSIGNILMEGCQVEMLKYHNKTAKYDINLSCTEVEQELLFEFEYNTSVFSKNNIQSFIGSYLALLNSLTVNPKVKIGELSYTSECDLDILKNHFNQTGVKFQIANPIHVNFQENVKRFPKNIAVTYKEDTISYLELHERSNQVANKLIELGICRNDIVGIYLDNSIDQVSIILGVLKAGAAYLPIDTSLPMERVEYIIDDSKAQLLISEQNISSGKLQNINLNKPEAFKARSSDVSVASLLSDLAYVIYTSGSTGKPKGVKISHKALNNFLEATNRCYNNGFGEEDICMSITNNSFDVKVAELFLPLRFGGQLLLMDNRELLDVSYFIKKIVNERVTFTYMPPMILMDIYNALKEFEGQIYLNKILVGVEPIKVSVLQLFQRLIPDVQLVNAYGPTESTICVTMHKYDENNVYGHSNVPIGKPMPNCRLYILDDEKKIVPIGTPGELYIAGDSLFDGYIGDTSDVSKDYEFNLHGEEKLYKTGDLVKMIPNEELMFLGRIDKQMKIRGVRVEPEEIETAILSDSRIKEVVVTIKSLERDTDSYEKVLIAYYTCEIDISDDEIRANLLTKLPPNILPDFFVKLDSIPLTINGKVDTAKLIIPKIEKGGTYNPPENEFEEEMVGIWAKVLNLDFEQVSVTSNFFELGGNSIKLVKLKTEIEKKLKVELSVVDLFNYATIRQLTKMIHIEHVPETNQIEEFN